ncbi:hypothetical protein M8494_16255 [Serratia ureilytica]
MQTFDHPWALTQPRRSSAGHARRRTGAAQRGSDRGTAAGSWSSKSSSEIPNSWRR